MKKQNRFLKCELNEITAGIYRQLKTEADRNKEGLGPQPALEQKTMTGTSIDRIRESKVHKQNKGAKRKQQKQPVDCATEPASKQIKILAAKVEKDVSLLKTRMDSLSNGE